MIDNMIDKTKSTHLNGIWEEMEFMKMKTSWTVSLNQCEVLESKHFLNRTAARIPLTERKKKNTNFLKFTFYFILGYS